MGVRSQVAKRVTDFDKGIKKKKEERERERRFEIKMRSKKCKVVMVKGKTNLPHGNREK